VPNCDFYAYGDDHRRILSYVLENLPCRLFELYSAYDSELVEFSSLEQIASHYNINNWPAGDHASMRFQLLPADACGQVQFTRIQLNSSRCNSATFRYSSDGWGLIQLYLESPRKGQLRQSHTNHNSEKRAAAWAATYPELNPPSDWDWAAVTSFSRKLNRFIRKTAVSKSGSRVVLPAASSFPRLATN